nr:MAG TPA: hypothetical protein [Bacteriophage sp.]
MRKKFKIVFNLISNLTKERCCSYIALFCIFMQGWRKARVYYERIE